MHADIRNFDLNHLTEKIEGALKIHDTVVIRTGGKHAFTLLARAGDENALDGANHRFGNPERLGVIHLLQLLQPGLNKALRLALVGTALMAVLLAALLAEGSLPPGAAVPVWVGLDTGGERTYNAE